MSRRLLLILIVLLFPVAAHAVTLTWQDNSTDEDGFRVERAPTITGTFTQIGQVGTNVVTFLDSAGVGGNCYRIRAFNTWGNSTYSNVACVGFPPSAPGGLIIAP